MNKIVNDQLALRVLQLIQGGSNNPSQLSEELKNEPEFHATLLDLTTKPDDILEVDPSSGNFVITGTASGAWPLNIHKFLDDHGYKSILQKDDASEKVKQSSI